MAHHPRKVPRMRMCRIPGGRHLVLEAALASKASGEFPLIHCLLLFVSPGQANINETEAVVSRDEGGAYRANALSRLIAGGAAAGLGEQRSTRAARG